MRARLLASLSLGALLAGCVVPAPQAPLQGPGVGALPPRPVVVAVLDTGLNPYHRVFEDPSGKVLDALAPRIPNATWVDLTRNGTYDERVKADTPFWSNVTNGRLYAFRGTRVLGMTFGSQMQQPILVFGAPDDHHVLDDDGHGTATTGEVATVAPSVAIVLLQVSGYACEENAHVNCTLDPSFARAMSWAADQPWIDVISVSAGVPANAPDPGAVSPEEKEYLAASERAATSGKLIVNAGNNEPPPTIPNYFEGPPWVVAVGGYEPHQHGEQYDAGRAVDVVSNYTQPVAQAGTLDGMRYGYGTSFATPEVAGVVAEAAARVRARLGGDWMDAHALREALNATAFGVDATSWDPTQLEGNDTLEAGTIAHGLPIVAGPAQIGWGVVDGRLVAPLAEAALAGKGGASRDGTTVAFMAQYQAAREAYWAQARSL